MLALSVLDTIIGIDKRGDWLAFLSTKGYLRHFIENLSQQDQELQESLQPTPEPLKALFIFESQMVRKVMDHTNPHFWSHLGLLLSIYIL